MNNPTLDPVDSIPFKDLTIQTDRLDKKALEGLDHTDSTTRAGSSGDSPNRWSNKARYSTRGRQRTSGMGAKDADRRGEIQTLHWSAKPRRK